MLADDGSPSDFLGVAHSCTGRPWRERRADPAIVRATQARFELTEPLARAIVSRGVQDDAVERFLKPTLKRLFPDPSSFADMDQASGILVDALLTDRAMVVFADYDVDGASSAAQLVRWFRAMGKELPIYVPDRLAEGYGPTPVVFRALREAGAELVVTVDCGAAATDALVEANRIGLHVVVIDHHLMRGENPPAAALVNPNRPDCRSEQGMLAAAGVTFVLLAALNREARSRGLFSARMEPDLRQWLDLAALGAICDVTQLVGFNRALVTQGLKIMSSWRNPGLAALMAASGAKAQEASPFEAGFILGPRINAGGRIGRADLGARLLSTDDPAEAERLAHQLDKLNHERKLVERDILLDACEAIDRDSNFDPNAPAIVVAREGWHPGVIGIAASRLREKYRKPVVVIGIDRAANVGRGSGRSQPGMNLGFAIQLAHQEGLLLTGGGHAMAAGLTIRPSAVPEFRAFLCDRLMAEMSSASAEDCVEIDALARPGDAARAAMQEFAVLAPHGPGNPEPLFALAGVRVERPIPMSGGHIRCTLSDTAGQRTGAIAWRSEGTALGARLLAGGTVHAAGKLKRNTWNGRDLVELEIEDIADPRRA